MDIRHWKDKNIAILGFGKEGQSSLQLIRKFFPEKTVAIADSNIQLPENHSSLSHIHWIVGKEYLSQVLPYDIIIKSPGIKLPETFPTNKITSQTALFLESYRNQIIGITGTKGKSTTTTLIYHIIKGFSSNVLLAGNIGTPVWDVIDAINDKTEIILEFSAHQLQYVNNSPHIAVITNLFPEHLDHFNTLEDYYKSKLNILLYQTSSDIAIINSTPDLQGDLYKYLPQDHNGFLQFAYKKKSGVHAYLQNNTIHCLYPHGKIFSFDLSRFPLTGKHNRLNAMAAVLVTIAIGIPPQIIQKRIESFCGLPHRLQKVGTFNGITFYNDSISTIPQTTIQALEALPNTHTLIVGGYDRGIDYSSLYHFLDKSSLRCLILTGTVGKRIAQEYQVKIKTALLESMDEIIEYAYKETPPETICLLSPAASSYDYYTNFEHRGDTFVESIKKHAKR